MSEIQTIWYKKYNQAHVQQCIASREAGCTAKRLGNGEQQHPPIIKYSCEKSVTRPTARARKDPNYDTKVI